MVEGVHDVVLRTWPESRWRVARMPASAYATRRAASATICKVSVRRARRC